MLTTDELIKTLKSEIKMKNQINTDEISQTIYNDFKIFFKNKDKLKYGIKNSMFISEHVAYNNFFKDSIFDLFISNHIDLVNSAIDTDKEVFKDFFCKSLDLISKGEKNWCSLSRLQEDKSNLKKTNFFAVSLFRDLRQYDRGDS